MKKKVKSQKVVNFFETLHEQIISSPLFRHKTKDISERQIQAELRPLIFKFLGDHFKNEGFLSYEKLAHDNFYWEGQESNFHSNRTTLFGTKRYPDFIFTRPYNVAIEYKKSDSPALLYVAVGQAIFAVESGDYDFCYVLFQDETKDKRCLESKTHNRESLIIKDLWKSHNVWLEIK